MAENVKIIAVLGGPNRFLGSPADQEGGIRRALQRILDTAGAPEALNCMVVESIQIVPAAAGEGETEDPYAYTNIPLDKEQMGRAQQILRTAAASPILDVMQMAICPQTRSLIGWIRMAGSSQLFSHVVSEKAIRTILG